MNNPAGFGGILLLLAAVVWLIIFVPGYAQRSQLAARTNLLRRSQREAYRSIPLTPGERLGRLINTQRGFSLLFAVSFLGAIAAAVAAAVDASFWFLAGLLVFFSLSSLVISRLAAKQAAELAHSLHSSRQQIRSSAARNAARANAREWTPNPLPAPLARVELKKEDEKLAEVINITSPARTISSKELDEILARRRAI